MLNTFLQLNILFGWHYTLIPPTRRQKTYQKLGVVRTLMNRCETITTEKGDKKEENWWDT